MNTKIIIAVVAAISVAGSFGIFLTLMPTNTPPSTPYVVSPNAFDDTPLVSLEGSQELKKFSSYEELKKYLQTTQAQDQYYRDYGGPITLDRTVFPTPFSRTDAQWNMAEEAAPASAPVPTPTNGGVTDSSKPGYSTTNVQVKNVDEPDFLKNDDKYVYIVTGDKLTIIEAYPAETAKIILKVGIDIPQGQSIQNIFLNGDRLVIFYQDYQETDYIPQYNFAPSKIYTNLTHIVIMDVSSKESPKIIKDYSVNGYYHNARMIGNLVYLISIAEVNHFQPIIPLIREDARTIISPDVFYFDNPESYHNFNTVTAIDVFADKIKSETFMMGGAGTIYMSENNLYITYQKNLPYRYYQVHEKTRFFEAIVPVLPTNIQTQIKQITNDSTLSESEKWSKVSDLLQNTYNSMSQSEKSKLFEKIQSAINDYELKIQQETLKTVIHKIGLNSGELKYLAKGEVPGRLLNQFSMDESENRFRIATTSEFYSNRSYLHNNVYVLDENLMRVGALEQIAKDESIYSARFMGDRLYLVTFQRMDPFFVIDLSTDTPKVLGELKIPGFSQYLHPYDENHVIGIGRDTKENQWGGVQTEGVKLALFDVTDVSKPSAVDVEIIGKQGTDSEVLNDHKAMLFDKQKGILSIPISNYNYNIEPYYKDGRYVEPTTWRGFYVYDVKDSGFDLKGTIMHSNGTGYEYYGYGSRSFYIDDTLYTVSSNLMKMNAISDLHEVNQIKFRDEAKLVRYID
ncbi:beta-propeller domain-containing protein [Candidatus Nitrosotenuis aquarius]|uniref:beta-propeller domain-containing protein n=1 Tax=Candidatus Nitrosotenuis aquarius TaxID=1846278 RepID=UPI000C1EAF9C|nr:beta-propeller domain-containing protein [Candidatus Nitrosotenuis aquarius]